MSNLVIVAIPDENDRVWKVSSEKVPHLTLLFLGEMGQVANVQKIVDFVEHAANTSLSRFYLTVDRRGELGNDPQQGPADVLFFKKTRYDFKAVRDFRAALLQDNNIKTAYDAAQQFEGWTPHLTLGYQTSPAKEDKEDYPFYDVSFNKIAVWTGDYEGPEFLLKDHWDDFELPDVPMDVAMSSLNDARRAAGLETLAHHDVKKLAMTPGAAFVDGLVHTDLAHYGIKGMRWGHRKAEPPSAVPPTAASRVPHGDKRKTQIDVQGGENHPAHPDAIKVAQARVKLAKSGPAALSNQELRDVATRIQLEGQVKELTRSSGHKFVRKLLGQQGKEAANQAVRQQVKKRVSFA